MSTLILDSAVHQGPSFTLPVSLQSRPLSADEIASRRAEAVARALPDDLFAHHQEIIWLTSQWKASQARLEGIRATQSHAVADAVTKVEAELRAARENLKTAAVDDALASDYDFPRAVAVHREIEELEIQVKAARLAYEVLSLSPPQKQVFVEPVSTARNALGNALLRLKREHVRAHPELLGQQ